MYIAWLTNITFVIYEIFYFINSCNFQIKPLVPLAGLEPAWYRYRGILSKKLFLWTISLPSTKWSGSGRSCLLLRRLTSQVVSTPSLGLPNAWLALRVPHTSAEFNHLFDTHFCVKGTPLYDSPLCLPIPPQRHIFFHFSLVKFSLNRDIIIS